MILYTGIYFIYANGASNPEGCWGLKRSCNDGISKYPFHSISVKMYYFNNKIELKIILQTLRKTFSLSLYMYNNQKEQ